MPEFSYNDRCMLHAENTLWIVHKALMDIEHSGSWCDRIDAVRKELREIATELTTYNEQFETVE